MPASADIWHLWFHRDRDDMVLFRQVLAGDYRLSPLLITRRYASDDSVALWSARDALVLKWVALQISDLLPMHDSCVHVKGKRGGRDSLQEITCHLKNGVRFMYRTDIRGYYRHILKEQLFHRVCRYVSDPVLQNLIHQYLYYSVEEGGIIRTPATGITRGCALSPLMGATLLHYIDSYFSHIEGIHYVRYMDDFLFLSERRWPVRRARTQLHEFLSQGGFECHPDKTQIGRVEKGFDWLGVWFTEQGPTGIAPRALANHRCRRLRLQEQALRSGLSPEATAIRVQQYEKRWNIWAEERLRSCKLP